MNASIRYGPTPPDLKVGKPPKATYGVRVAQTFIPVRARVDGAWRLGVVREWIRSRSGWLVRIETVDATSAVGVCSEWYEFRPDAVDRLNIAAASGEVRLAPPQAAGRDL
ncbi:hypothetical protein GCM10009839_89020 [Catenulispora yoronensis]|uniref:Uncharacterized protein n=1 Tax=Catenulispora yoronensis TaxID=450799 RepID=A0ABN2VKT0_9ACTN